MEFQVAIPFVQHLGFELQRWEDGQAEISYTPTPDHLNSFNVVHGGASMTLLDVVMAHAARSVQQDMGAVTIEMKTSFVRAAHGPLVATGCLLHRTATMAFTEGRVVDASGQLCAHATGSRRTYLKVPVGARAAHDLNPGRGIASD
jgi:uncharacterized protein (TIGR00369 family)